MTFAQELPDIRDFLNEKAEKYNHSDFIETDPIQIPHLFSDKNDIEIAAFFASTIAWGQRVTIIKNMHKLIGLMDHSPYEFIMNSSERDLNRLNYFKHRTFNGEDCKFFVKSLNNIYQKHGGLGELFQKIYLEQNNIFNTLIKFREIFFDIEYPLRTQKHVSNVLKGSSAKRLNMFLRWMVRNDNNGVDFGLWDKISMSDLFLPLDVHTGNVARKLGLLKRKQNDWKAVAEITSILREFDPKDPIKYDFALFGLGVFEKF
ncbi:MAG: TIGR02757 family protein [Bacteroidales bacterium]|nr:TIGR02757 family protein [Bacteroidales bacterium]